MYIYNPDREFIVWKLRKLLKNVDLSGKHQVMPVLLFLSLVVNLDDLDSHLSSNTAVEGFVDSTKGATADSFLDLVVLWKVSKIKYFIHD